MSEERYPEPGSDATPWEPPLSGPEADQLVAALDRQRWTFRFKADGLDRAGLTTRLGASGLTLGGLLKHLALVEDHYSTVKLSGEPLPTVWADLGLDDHDEEWDFRTAAGDAPSDLYSRYDDAVERARTAIRNVVRERGLDGDAHASMPDGRHANVRRVLLDLVEEYARHVGHADLLREAVDGRTGEDPPDGWRPGV